jgi:outer membrane biosynthesis protein TonB
LVIAANFAFDQLRKENTKDKDDEYNGMLVEEDVSINDISKEAGKMEKEMVEDEPKPLKPSDELISRLELELSKITSKKDELEKTNQITDDLSEKINILSEKIDLDVDEKTEEKVKEEPKEEIKEKPQVTPTPNKKRIIYRRRDGGNNTRIDRF